MGFHVCLREHRLKPRRGGTEWDEESEGQRSNDQDVGVC